MKYKIYLKGNYVIIEKTNPKELFNGLKKDVFIDRNNKNKDVFRIYNVKNFNSEISINIADILKEDGSNYTSVEWETFYTENTGISSDDQNLVQNYGEESIENSSSINLLTGQTFTGEAELNDFPSIMVTVKTDKKGILYIEFSPDGVNWDSSISYPYDPTLINPPQILTKASRYSRVRFSNTSGEDQTYFRLNTYYGDFQKLTNSLNSIIPQTFGATVTRPIDFNLMVAKRLYQGHEPTLKDGINTSISTGTTPEDIWGGGGTYTGFPLVIEQGQIVVAGADTGTVYYSYMASPDDESYTFGSFAVTGANTYNLGHNIWRCNYALFVGTGTSPNIGSITVRQATTTTNIFCQILAGQGQTFCAAYTVPKGHTAYFDRITGSIRGGNSGASADMFFWWRRSSQTPLLRVPFVLNYGSLYFDDIDYLIDIPEGTDIIPRCTGVTNNNTVIHVSYRIIKVKN